MLWLTKTTFYCTVTRYTYLGVVADNLVQPLACQCTLRSVWSYCLYCSVTKECPPLKTPTFGSNSCITRISIYQSHKWLAISCWFEKRWKPHSSFNWPNAAAVLWRPLWYCSTYSVCSSKLWLKGGELWMLTDYVKVQAATMATTHGHSLVTLQYCHWASQTHNSTDGVGYLN